jgi:hypothetical protein
VPPSAARSMAGPLAQIWLRQRPMRGAVAGSRSRAPRRPPRDRHVYRLGPGQPGLGGRTTGRAAPAVLRAAHPPGTRDRR